MTIGDVAATLTGERTLPKTAANVSLLSMRIEPPLQGTQAIVSDHQAIIATLAFR